MCLGFDYDWDYVSRVDIQWTIDYLEDVLKLSLMVAMNRYAFQFSKLIIIVSLIVCHSCEKEDPEDVDDGSTKISESAIIFTESEWENSIKSVDETSFTFTFSEDQDFEIGDVIVSEAGDGYLRKITDIQLS